MLFALAGACDDIDLKNTDTSKLAQLLGAKQDQVEASIQFWANAGVVSVETSESVKASENIEDEKSYDDGTKVMVRRSDEIPN